MKHTFLSWECVSCGDKETSPLPLYHEFSGDIFEVEVYQVDGCEKCKTSLKKPLTTKR